MIGQQDKEGIYCHHRNTVLAGDGKTKLCIDCGALKGWENFDKSVENKKRRK